MSDSSEASHAATSGTGADTRAVDILQALLACLATIALHPAGADTSSFASGLGGVGGQPAVAAKLCILALMVHGRDGEAGCTADAVVIGRHAFAPPHGSKVALLHAIGLRQALAET